MSLNIAITGANGQGTTTEKRAALALASESASSLPEIPVWTQTHWKFRATRVNGLEV